MDILVGVLLALCLYGLSTNVSAGLTMLDNERHATLLFKVGYVMPIVGLFIFQCLFWLGIGYLVL